MRHYIVSVRDLKVESYSRPFFVNHLGEATRSFQDEVVSGDAKTSMIAKHPADFQLWCLGIWDDSTGAFGSDESSPRLLAHGSDFAK